MKKFVNKQNVIIIFIALTSCSHNFGRHPKLYFIIKIVILKNRSLNFVFYIFLSQHFILNL